MPVVADVLVGIDIPDDVRLGERDGVFHRHRREPVVEEVHVVDDGLPGRSAEDIDTEAGRSGRHLLAEDRSGLMVFLSTIQAEDAWPASSSG